METEVQVLSTHRNAGWVWRLSYNPWARKTEAEHPQIKQISVVCVKVGNSVSIRKVTVFTGTCTHVRVNTYTCVWIKMVTHVWSATGLGPLLEAGCRSFDCSFSMLLQGGGVCVSGCEKPQPLIRGGGAQSGVLGTCQSRAQGSGPAQRSMTSGSQTLGHPRGHWRPRAGSSLEPKGKVGRRAPAGYPGDERVLGEFCLWLDLVAFRAGSAERSPVGD